MKSLVVEMLLGGEVDLIGGTVEVIAIKLVFWVKIFVFAGTVSFLGVNRKVFGGNSFKMMRIWHERVNLSVSV